MPINRSEMDDEQSRAVAVALVERLGVQHNPGDPDDVEGIYDPFRPGKLRRSRSGAQWCSFGGDVWHRALDINAADDGSYSGARAVLDDEGRPFGCSMGVLMLHRIKGRWLAQAINTGWNFSREIEWSDAS